jgi:hypothetical protein
LTPNSHTADSLPHPQNNSTTQSSSAIPYTYSGLDFSDPAWTPVVIRGDVEAALAAGRGLADTCGTLDEVVMDVPLPRARHAAVIGKNGRVLAKLSGDHNVRIMIPFKQAKHDMIQLEGDLPNVSACLADLLTVATNSSNNGSVTESLVLPRMAFSQSRLRALARRTDCRIKKKSVDEINWQIFVTGKTSQVATALQVLRKWKEAVSTAATTTTTTTSSDPSSNKSSPATSNPSTRNGSGGISVFKQQSRRRRQRRDKGSAGGGNNNNNNNNNNVGTMTSSSKGTPVAAPTNSSESSNTAKRRVNNPEQRESEKE